MKKQIAVFALCVVAFVISCNQHKSKEADPGLVKEKQSEDSTLNLARNYFKVLPSIAANSDNVVTPSKVKLGKVLFL